MIILSLFPGIGLLDMAFEEEGFCVVRGPDLLWGGDIKQFHPPSAVFDGVIGGPPCQAFSRMVHLIRANGYRVAPNLIPEFERVTSEAEPLWWVMENVPGAPIPFNVSDSALLKDCDCGGSTSRIRRISWAGIDLSLPDGAGADPLYKSVVCDAREIPVAIGGSGKRKKGLGGQPSPDRKALSVSEMLRRQGFPEDMLDDCPLTAGGKRKAIGNGVPLPMGRAIARAVKRAIEHK